MKFVRAKKAAALAAVIVAPLASGAAQAQSADFRAYANSDYGYCDAKKVAHVWGKNVGQAKAIIGAKIRNRLEKLIRADIRSTANSVYCAWNETDLSFRDAKKLARYWGRSVGDAKLKAKALVSKWGTRKFRKRMRDALS
jgi:hypothetical protein